MNVYYNEHDRFATAWLRELIREGLIPEGDVDERDIQLVQSADLAGYQQCHFFAGIGGWAYALKLAEWVGPVWTGSCPCQPFSSAGKGGGFEDSRHLWPTWFRLIRECRPPVVFGEQVASADGLAWFDHVSADLEAEAYAVGAADLAAASVGAPHKRQRLFFVGDTVSKGLEGHAGDGTGGFRHLRKVPKQDRPTGPASLPGVGLADAHGAGQRSGSGGVRDERDNAGRGGAAGELGNSAGARRNEWRAEPSELGEERLPLSDAGNPWDDVVWLPCSDGKARPTQSGIFPLVDGVPNRVGTLRGAGNAIVPQAAAEFVRAFLEARRAR